MSPAQIQAAAETEAKRRGIKIPQRPRPIAPLKLTDLTIRTKDEQLVPFAPNEVQAHYLAAICPDWQEGEYRIRALRETILKFRQPGFSTLIGALIFLNTYNRPNVRSLILAQDLEATKILFEMYRRFYNNLPTDHQRPLTEDSKTGMHFTDIDSRIYVGTAGRYSMGRGATLNYLHMSERAKWHIEREALKELDAGLKEAVPESGCIWKETTAHGRNYFHAEYQADKGGETPYRSWFFGWSQHAEYERDPGPNFTRTREEQEIARQHGLTDRKLAWRRWKVSDLKDLFPQEYPLDDEEAFLASLENNVFDAKYLSGLLPFLVDPDHEAETDWQEGHPETYPVGRDGLCGTLDVWERPQKGIRYCIGADVAEGLRKDKTDESTADVLRLDTWEHVASYHGKPDPRSFGMDLYNLAHWYNDAEVIPENNSFGVGTVAMLREMGARIWESDPDSELDAGSDDQDTVAGLRTTRRTKGMVDGELRAAIVDAAAGRTSIVLNSRRCVEQCIHYVYLPSGGRGGEGNWHDDHVRSLGLAWYVAKDYGLRPPPDRQQLHGNAYGGLYRGRGR